MKRTKNMVYKPTAEASELYVYADNHSELYHRELLPIMDHLRKFIAAGTYNHDRAIDFIYRYMCLASKEYGRDFDYEFSVQDRFTAAVDMEADLFENYL